MIPEDATYKFGSAAAAGQLIFPPRPILDFPLAASNSAVEANPADPRIGIKLHPEPGTNGRGGLQIDVQDNGAGFTAETAQKAPATPAAAAPATAEKKGGKEDKGGDKKK